MVRDLAANQRRELSLRTLTDVLSSKTFERQKARDRAAWAGGDDFYGSGVKNTADRHWKCFGKDSTAVWESSFFALLSETETIG